MNLFRYAFKICNFTKQKALLEALKFHIYMSKLKRYENFENLKADTVATLKTSPKKEIALKNFFVNLRKYKITKEDFLNNNSKLYGG